MTALEQRRVSIDFETHLIKHTKRGKAQIAHMLAPRCVCMSLAEATLPAGPRTVELLERRDALRRLAAELARDDTLIVGHNLPFDFGCAVADEPELLAPVFRAYAGGRARDTKPRQQLIDIAEGESEFRRRPGMPVTKANLHLDDLAKLWLGRALNKGSESPRLRYALRDGLPISCYTDEEKDYAIADAVGALDVFDAQERFCDGDEIPDELPQQRAAWALHLMSAWGLRTDPVAVAKLRDELEHEHKAALEVLQPAGLVRPDGSKDMKKIYARIEEALGERTPRTETGKPCTDEETLISTGDGALIVLAKSMKGAKVLSTYVPVLELGAHFPVCASYNVLVDTGRTSCASPNMQNPPRAGGVRACFVPRAGFVFGGADYDTLELRTLAQTCLDILGESELAAALNAGVDPHLALAADLLGLPYEAALERYKAGDIEIDEMRQLCKIANFGFPGGMAAETFVAYAAGYEINGKPVLISLERAEELRDAWRRRWREMFRYFDFVGACVGDGLDAKIRQIRSGRVRGDVRFTSCANGFFQGLAADGAKWALWCVAVECYLGICTSCRQHGDPLGKLSLDLDGPGGIVHERFESVGIGAPFKPGAGVACPDCGGTGKSALEGSRPVIFMHDEIVCEMPEAKASAAAERLGALMVRCMRFFVPDVKCGATPVLTRRWFKGAKPVRVDGQLVPCKPRKTSDGKKTWIPDVGERIAA